MTAKKINAFLDIVSPYSYFAFLHLKRNERVLTSHGVEVEIHPIFLGGVNHGSGNKPPWTLPAKAKYLKYDNARAKKYFNAPNLKTPESFPIVSLLPQRCLCYIKEAFAKEKFHAALLELWIALWEQNKDISKPEILREALKRVFVDQETDAILKAAGEAQYKQILTDNTQRALNSGAFGAPWFMVNDGNGNEEPFFGSDRFHFMWEYLGLPWSDVEIKEKSHL